MRVRCTYRRGDKIPDEVLALGNTPESEFHLTQGKDYIAYGMLLWGGILHYLVIDDDLRWPHWLPACFFRAVNARLPSNWRFSSERDNTRVLGTMIWGYPELVAPDALHASGLTNREPEALLIFDRVRQEREAAAAREV
jgi:hypothetical protein